MEPVAVVGPGRLGKAVAAALRSAGGQVSGPHGRGYRGVGDRIVLLCVPDDVIAQAASIVVTGPLLGHCSGATGLDVLGSRGGFSVHPLMTVTPDGADFRGVWAAVAGSSRAALRVARELAAAIGLRPVDVADDDRAAYHAAAAMAANFLVTLESAAAELMSTAGLHPEVLLPLARAALENWGRTGPAALTGPVARGDAVTVGRHRAVIATRTPELIAMFDAMVAATERMVALREPGDAGGAAGGAAGAVHLEP